MSFRGSIGGNPALMAATRASWLERKRANSVKNFGVSGFCMGDYTRDLEAVGILVYEEAKPATYAVAALAGFARSFGERRPRPAVPAPASLPSGSVNELAVLNIVTATGVPTVPARHARTARKAGDAAPDLGFPVVPRCCRRTSSTRATSGEFASASPTAPPPRPPSTRSSPLPARRNSTRRSMAASSPPW